MTERPGQNGRLAAILVTIVLTLDTPSLPPVPDDGINSSNSFIRAPWQGECTS